MDADNVSEFNKRQLFNMIVGDHIGSGAHRQVYRHRLDNTLVVKIEDAAQSFCNIIEWEVWNAVKGTEHAKWFAPCVSISPCGSVMFQRRTVPAANYPDKVPAYFTDFKLTNYGVLVAQSQQELEASGGQFVCHDYGLHLMLQKGMTNRMRAANWWNL